MGYQFDINESVIMPYKSGEMKNTLYTGDNIHFLNRMDSESVDLIYLDPPFNSKRTWAAPIGSKSAGASFKDMWTWDDIDEQLLETLIIKHPCLVGFITNIGGIHGKPMMSYIVYMAMRIIELQRILKSTGTIYLHCDPTASHYLKIVMDKVFGRDNFINEIVWHYRTYQGKVSTYYPKKHDVIFWYAKDKNKRDKSSFELQYDDEYHGTVDYKRWRKYYNDGTNEIKYGKHPETDSRFTAYLNAWIKENGREPREGEIIYRCRGYVVDDVWQIQAIDPKDKKEKTGYPTQKPLELLNRIIKLSTKEGDIVFDPFCGCATTCVSAQLNNRKWIGIDIEAKAADVLLKRLDDSSGLLDTKTDQWKDFIHTHILPTRSDLPIEKPTQPIKQLLYDEQGGKCNACGNEMRIIDFEIDHIIPKSKGGNDTKENYQLLCGYCNKTKGNRPMEYLREKIRQRDELLSKQITFDK